MKTSRFRTCAIYTLFTISFACLLIATGETAGSEGMKASFGHTLTWSVASAIGIAAICLLVRKWNINPQIK